MGTNRWQERSFIEQVAAHHGCDVKRSRGGGDWELRATTGGIGWRCRLRPIGDEAPTEIRWLVGQRPALDHQIQLGLALAHRVRAVRGFWAGPGQ